jgi:hypothetical protein
MLPMSAVQGCAGMPLMLLMLPLLLLAAVMSF